MIWPVRSPKRCISADINSPRVRCSRTDRRTHAFSTEKRCENSPVDRLCELLALEHLARSYRLRKVALHGSKPHRRILHRIRHPLAASNAPPILETEYPMQSHGSTLLTVRETMALLKIGKTTFYKLIRGEELDAVYIDSRTRVTESSVKALIARKMKRSRHHPVY